MKYEAIHSENDVYRDANYAKQKQKQMSAYLQLIKIKTKAIRHWIPVVGWLSERCRLEVNQMIHGSASEIPTNLASVELFVTSFCSDERQ